MQHEGAYMQPLLNTGITHLLLVSVSQDKFAVQLLLDESELWTQMAI
jgi:hypothetical protein